MQKSPQSFEFSAGCDASFDAARLTPRCTYLRLNSTSSVIQEAIDWPFLVAALKCI